MQRRVAGAVVGVVVVLIAFPAIAFGGPTPVYTASCVVNGSTGGDWVRAKVVQVTIPWNAPAGSGVSFDPLVVSNASATPPRGMITTATPSVNGVAPESATFSFQQKNGTVDRTTVSCG